VASLSEITFVVPGQPQTGEQGLTRGGGAPMPAAEVQGRVKAAVRVSARRGAGETVRIAARPGDDIVVLHIANGPTLYLHPENARELMRAQVGDSEQTARGAAEPPIDAEVQVPAQLIWRGLESAGATRGGGDAGVGGAFVDAIEVVTDLVTDKAADLVTAAATRNVDGQVDPGVYQLSPDRLAPLKGRPKISSLPTADAPILVLAHGTFVETSSTFGKLWENHPARVQALFQQYSGRVFALDHPTVGASPFANAVTLAETLPDGARLHLITHSRGGLVAEALARVAAGQGLRDEDRAIFDDEAYGEHRANLDKLATLAKQGSFRVERLVRVACPARGTLLASRRLDAYLSVLKWGLKLAGVPVAPVIVGFLAEIARRRADPAKLPGLEAMMPDRPFAKWLNASADAIPGDLRVVAGDMEGDSVFSWVKTLISDAFYWTDNDLVVQTRSMYGGAPRSNAASFLLDRGGGVSHFNYFANERTAEAITRSLLQDQPDEFRPIGPLSWAGEDSSGVRAARPRAGNASERPAVFVLPGILGSNLKVDGQRIWLSLRLLNNLAQLKWDPTTAGRVQPDGPVGMSYDDLMDRLADTHEVIPFSFDWRRRLEEEARRLADSIDNSLAARAVTRQPVRVVAHSMGGLLVRALRLERPETWKRMLEREGARVLMLGAPNGGSWAPMQVLSGDDTFGNMLTAFGSLFNSQGARQIIAEMPGLMQLQAGLLDPSLGLDKEAGWSRLADADLRVVQERIDKATWWHNDPLQLDPHKWGVPTKAALDKAVDLRKRLDAQRDDLGADASKILLVVGKAPTTPAGVQVTESGVAYVVGHGDGRVTYQSARLPGLAAWKVDAAHGDLASTKDAFDAYIDLLTLGGTFRLEALSNADLAAPAARGSAGDGPDSTLYRPSRTARGEPPATQRDVFAAVGIDRPTQGAARVGPRLRISVVNGNLKFVREPLLLGHYQSLKLTGSEADMDRLLGGAMSASLNAGLYPSTRGSSQVFLNVTRNTDDPYIIPRPAAVVVAGLGEEGTLRATDLASTVRQTMLGYAQRLAESNAPATFDLAATLIGSGGIGIQVETAAQAIARGVGQANDRTPAGWPVVANLQLIELYLDRATDAHHALSVLAADYPQKYELAPQVELRAGCLTRPPNPGYRGAGYDFISVERRDDDDGKVGATIEFTLDTKRARSEVRGKATQSRLVDELVRVAASNDNRNEKIGRSLFKLLTPIELQQFLSGSSSVVLQLDRSTATYPWELLDTQAEDQREDVRPWAVRTRMLRKLRTSEFRDRPLDARRGDGALVIGEPKTDRSRYPALPGARDEARAVAEILGVEAKLDLDALAVVNAVLDAPSRILHVAGHGDILEDGTGGVVLSSGTVFGPREIESLRGVPELAFINCCFLGQIEPGSAQTRSQLGERRPKFAANVAEQLIRIGVRCVIAAGWAVDDGPAKLFATSFYQALTEKRTFAEAVGNARERTHGTYPNSNTWAAYQCYGDPDWRYIREDPSSEAQTSRRPAVLSAPDLALELETLAVRARYDKEARSEVRTRLEQLDGQHAARWGSGGAVAQAMGAAYSELGDPERAIYWYSRASQAEDGAASFRAAEQLANLRARRGARMKDAAEGRREIQAAIAQLERLLAIDATIERASLLGSAYKRLAIREGGGKGRNQAWQKAIAAMAKSYGQAEVRARETNADNLFYPTVNRMIAELMLNAGRAGYQGFDAADLAAARQSLQKKANTDPDFWSVVGLTELRIYDALANGSLAASVEGIVRDLTNVKARANAPTLWESPRDQAVFALSPLTTGRTLSKAERDAALRLLDLLEEFAKK
jgi:tetratricopeptide (TPR) repeat protein